MLSTSVELHLGLELPVAISNIPGNAGEAGCLFENKEQIHDHHECNVKIDIADLMKNAKDLYFAVLNNAFPLNIRILDKPRVLNAEKANILLKSKSYIAINSLLCVLRY